MAGFTAQMRSVSIELRFQIDEHRATCRKLLICDGLLKFRVTFVHLRVERGGVEFLARHSKLVDERQFKVTQAFNCGVASAFTECRGAATRDQQRGGAEESISEDHKLRGIRIHKTRVVRFSILRGLSCVCQDMKGFAQRAIHAPGGSALESGRALPHSKTQATNVRWSSRPRFGVRRCCAAFGVECCSNS